MASKMSKKKPRKSMHEAFKKARGGAKRNTIEPRWVYNPHVVCIEMADITLNPDAIF